MSEDKDRTRLPGKIKGVLPRFSLDVALGNAKVSNPNPAKEDYDYLDQALTEEDKELLREAKRARLEEILLQRQKRKLELEADIAEARSRLDEIMSKREKEREKGEKKVEKKGEEIELTTESGEKVSFKDPLSNPEVVKALSELPDDKREKAWQALIAYSIATKNPSAFMLNRIIDVVKETPQANMKQADPIDLVSKTLDLIKKMREETEPKEQQVIQMPEKKSIIDEIFDDEMKKMFKDFLKSKLIGRGKEEVQKVPVQEDTELIYDEEAKMWIPRKLTFPEYKEIDQIRWQRIKEKEKLKQDEEKTKMIGEHLLKPLGEKIGTIVDAGIQKLGPKQAQQIPKEQMQKEKPYEAQIQVGEKGAIFPCQCGNEIPVRIKDGKVLDKVIKCPKCGQQYEYKLE